MKNVIILLMGFAGSGKRTVGQALAKKTSFRFVHHHSWIDPILNLLGNDSSVWFTLTDKAWGKLNAVRDIILSTIADVCPSESSFIITYEMIDQDPYHQIFYEKVLDVADKRNAVFLPVRLICDEDELVARVQSEDRKQYLKTGDADMMRTRSREKSVFQTGHKNELTINNSALSPEKVSDLIIKQLDRI